MKPLLRFLCAWIVAAGACMAAENRLLSEFTLRRWTVEDGMPEAVVVSVEQRADGYLWCTTPHHLLRFDGIRFVEVEGGRSPRSPTKKARLSPDQLARAPFLSEAKASDGITAMLTDSEGGVWVGTLQGLYRWHGNRWGELTARDGVFPWDVWCLAMDREGNIWVGTSGGLVRLRQKRVSVFRTGLTVGDESITALLAESPTKFWVGVAGGGLLTGSPEALRPSRMGAMPPDATVSVILRGRDGTLWIGTQGDSLWQQRPDGSVSLVRPAERGSPQARGISALLEDRRGRLWVGTWEGLMQVSPRGELVPVFERGTEGSAFPSEMVQELYEDRSGQVWVGYPRSGLVCFQTDGKVRRYRKADGVPYGSAFVLHEDAEGAMWIGSTGGLARWKGNQRHVFTTANGLVDDVILQILEDEEGDLWLGTRRGLMRVQKREFEEIAAGRKAVVAARQLGIEAGMADEECTGRFGAHAERTADGRLWFPTMEGIVMVEPKRITHVTSPPSVHLEEVLANGVPMPPQEGVLRLPIGNRHVEFHFTATGLTAPDHVHFKFQLMGHDPEWSRATTDRSTVYANLPAGEYRFRVIARDRDSGWSEPTPELALIVPPHFWETLWFRVMVALAAIAAVAAGTQGYYRRQATLEIEMLERRHAVERERARIARDIHDDVGAGLTEVAMLSELAQEESQRPAELHKHLDAIFRRARDLAQSLNEIVWAINPANDTLESLLSYVGEFAQDFLEKAGTACRLDLPINLPSHPLGSNLRHHLCLAIKEVLHNVAKHAEAREVRLAVSLDGNALTITISDDGRGFEPASFPDTRGGHDGLSNLRARLAEIGGTFRQESRRDRGTRTVLSVELPTAPPPQGEPD